MALLGSVINVLGKIESADITVYPERCAVVRNRNARCLKCADACTSGAISIEDNQMVVTPNLCIGCGTCATVCPTCALEARRPNDAELLMYAKKAMEANGGPVVFACRQAVSAASDTVDRSRFVEIACLGRLEETEMTCLLAAGATELILVQGDCVGCANRVGLETARLVMSTMETLLSSWGQDCPVSLAAEFPGFVRASAEEAKEAEAVDGVSRRHFLNRLRYGLQGVAVKAVDSAVGMPSAEASDRPMYVKTQEDGTLPHFLPTRRERLLDALAVLGKPMVETIDTRLWGHVTIDTDLCSSCRMCATFCPTGAIIKFDDEDGTFGILHFPGDCVQCRTCADICPQGALRVSSAVGTRELISGEIERHVMREPETVTGPHQMLTAMKKFIKCDHVYER